MELKLKMFLIVCPLVFLAALIDAIGGGGGLISLPAFLLAGLPPHMAAATNKLCSSCGTTVVTARLIKNKLVDFKLAIPSVIMAIIGASIGAKIALLLPDEMFLRIMLFILPVCAFLVLNRKIFKENESEDIAITGKTYIVAAISAFVVGMYDGMYGPGTGTFLIIAFTVFAKMSIKKANGQAKVINLTSNITSLVVFLINRQVLIPLGLAAAICNMAGGYIGAGLAIKNGSKITKPCIILVLCILLVKIIIETL